MHISAIGSGTLVLCDAAHARCKGSLLSFRVVRIAFVGALAGPLGADESCATPAQMINSISHVHARQSQDASADTTTNGVDRIHIMR